MEGEIRDVSRCVVFCPRVPNGRLRFCPFRFLHEGNGGGIDRVGQPPPPMFGFGRHMCPGRDLSKLEIVLFLSTFLRKYSYRLVKRQVSR
ncbi:unnamed protein product [Ascophyllum nodosum]